MTLLLLSGCVDYFVDGRNTAVESVTVTEQFAQAPLPMVDVLFVMDGTGSMAAEQARLGGAVAEFVDALDAVQVRYQIGVVSMDPADGGALQGAPWILTPADGEVAARLAENLAVGTDALPPSAGLDAAALALADADGLNIGFRRPDAALQVIFVSDADDGSGDVLGADAVSAFVGVLDAEAARTGHAARASAVVGDLPGGCFGSGGTALPGVDYAAVAAATGGQVSSICADDYAAIVTGMADASVEWQRRFPLQATPAAGSVTVTVDGARADGWTVDDAGPALVFDVAPPPDSWIEVRYDLAVVAS